VCETPDSVGRAGALAGRVERRGVDVQSRLLAVELDEGVGDHHFRPVRPRPFAETKHFEQALLHPFDQASCVVVGGGRAAAGQYHGDHQQHHNTPSVHGRHTPENTKTQTVISMN